MKWVWHSTWEKGKLVEKLRSKNLKGRDQLGSRGTWKDDIQMSTKQAEWLYSGFICLKIGTSSGLFGNDASLNSMQQRPYLIIAAQYENILAFYESRR
jgi:hypothetical protein